MNRIPTKIRTCSTGACTLPKKLLPDTMRAWRMTSWMPMMLISVVSLLSVMSWEIVAGTMRRRPWGRITRRIRWA